MATAKKKNPKNPTVRPMPVGNPKPIGMTKPGTVPGKIAPKPVMPKQKVSGKVKRGMY